MAEFDTSHVKNIVLLGHAGSGKTTLAECMLYEAGLISRRGSVAERNTTGDYHELEQERGNSIFSKLLHVKWRGFKINIIDISAFKPSDECTEIKFFSKDELQAHKKDLSAQIHPLIDLFNLQDF